MDGDKSDKSDASGNWQYKPDDTTRDVPRSDPAETSDQGADVSRTDANNPMLHRDEYLPQSADGSADIDPSESVSWTASEFIAHQKSVSWYALLVLATLVIAAAVFLITRDKISTFVIVFVGIIFGIYAGRKPRTLKFTVDGSGLTIGDHFYEYGQFRSFAMVQEGAFSSIVFMPLRRFMPLITVYYDPKDEEKITDILSNRIPLDTHRLDYIEQFMRRIRF